MWLRDYKPNLAGPLKLRHLSVVVIQATFSSGVATLDTDASSPDVTIAKDTTGDYDITFPAGQFVHCIGVHLDPAADDPTDANVADAYPRSLDAGGTGKILFMHSDDGGLADPDDDTRLYLTLLVGKA